MLVTADSTGHGVPGAIMSILNIACLNEAVKEGYKLPNEILNRTREEVIKVLQRDGSAEGGKDGMDCSVCVYDFKNMMLWVAAANNPVWIVKNSGTEALEVHEIKPDKMPVGKHDKQDIPFKLQRMKLQKGDVIYTLTDGFPDQFGGADGKKFKVKRLRELLVSIANLPLSEQHQILETTFKNWVGSHEQIDDVTIIGVRV
ncbi:MAG: serine/threonine-protein phosphatase [Chitinophagaceae bacterium]|nr:serine/threonine-protein phosphatase [Chitinophagaceae bacterium]